MSPVIDVHTHMLDNAWVKLLEKHGGKYTMKAVYGGLRAIHLDGAPFMTPVPEMFDWELRIKNMDRVGIDVAVTSLSCPNVFWGGEKISLQAAQIMNDTMAKAHKQWPDRIQFFCSIPWQYPDAALKELKRARKAGVQVIVVQHSDAGDHRLAKGQPGWELRPEIAPLPGEKLDHKTACDSFFETDLESHLKAKGITHLVIGGCMTQYCVDTTTRRAVTLGYDVTLLGVGHLIDVLRGDATDKVTRFGHAQLPVFGIGRDIDAQAWKSLARQLVSLGYLIVQSDQFNTLAVSETARPLLKGETTLTLRRATVNMGKGKKLRRNGTAEATTAAALARADVAPELWDALRARRRDLATAQNLPPYVIFHDATLLEIAHRMPENLAAFLAIPGIGERKMKRYGADFLEVLAAHR